MRPSHKGYNKQKMAKKSLAKMITLQSFKLRVSCFRCTPHSEADRLRKIKPIG